MSDRLAGEERFLLTRVDEMADGDLERWFGYVALVGAHRWGLDLERDVEGQEFAHVDEALEDAMDDLAAAGRIGAVGDEVVDGALELLEMIEEVEDVDVHEPGPLAVRD